MFGTKRSVFFLTFVLSLICLGERFFKEDYKTLDTALVLFNEVPIGDNLMWRISYEEYNPIYAVDKFDSLELGGSVEDIDFDFVNMFALYPYKGKVYSRMGNQFCEYELESNTVGSKVNKKGCKAIPFTGETVIGIAFDRNATTAVLTNKNLRLYDNAHPFFPSMTNTPFFTFSLTNMGLDTTNVTRIHYSKGGVVFTQSSKQHIIAFDYSTGSLVGKIPTVKTDNEKFKVDLAVPTDDGFVFSAGKIIVHARYNPDKDMFISASAEVPTVLHGEPSEFLFDEVSRNVYIFTENNLTRISLNNFVVSGLDIISRTGTRDPVVFSHPTVFFGENGYLRCIQSRKNLGGKTVFEAIYIKTSRCPDFNKLGGCVEDSDYCEFNIRLKDGTSGSCREKKVEHENGWVDFVPTITKITPNRASTLGGTEITVTLDVDLPFSEQDGVECKMNSEEPKGTYDSKKNTVTCNVSDKLSKGEMSIKVNYKVSGKLVRTIERSSNHVEETKFQLYECNYDNGRTYVSPCSRCYLTSDSPDRAEDSECAWSLKDQECVNKNNKSLAADIIFVHSNECMVISSISPEEFDEGKSVDLVLDFEADKEWKQGYYKCVLRDEGDKKSQQVNLKPNPNGNGRICTFTPDDTKELSSDKKLNLTILYSEKEGGPTYDYISLTKPNANTIINASVMMTSCVSYKDCYSCASRSGCFWSLKDDGSFECVNEALKSKTYSVGKTSSCPSVMSDSYEGFLSKTEAEAECKKTKKFSVTVPISNIYSGLSPYCSTDNANWVKATVSDSSVICEFSLTCPVPANTQSFTIYISVSESKQTYVTVPFSITDCGSGIKDMDTCLKKDPNGHCGFDMKKKQGECNIQTNETLVSGTWTNKRIYINDNETNPEDLDYFDLQNKPIIIPVSFIPVDSERQFYCKLLTEDDSLIANTTKVNVPNTNEIECTFDVADVQSSLRVFGANDESPDTVIHIDDITQHDKIFVSFGELNNEGSPFNSLNKMEIAVVDCLAKNTTLSCGSCLDIESSDNLKHCGWSISAGMCMSDYHLQSETYRVSPGGLCPGFSRIDPVSRDKGDFTLNVYGNGFYNVGIEVIFVGKSDNKMYNFTSTFVDNSHLKVSVSSDLPVQEYDIILWYKNKPYTETANSVVFTITKPPLPFWIWIIVGVGGFLIIAAIFVIIIVVIRRRGGLSTFKFDVSEKPDLSQFAYIRPLQGKKKGSSDLSDDQKAQLAALLKDTTVAAAIYKAQDASSTDNVAAAMVYINSYNGCGLKFVETLAKKEVEGTKTVEQLFRESTLATKAASAYLRMMGIEYLWDSLALFVNELNYIVKKQQGSSSEAEKPVDLDGDGASSTSSAAGLEAERLGAASGEDLELRRYLFEQRARNLVLCVNGSSGDVPPEIHYLIFASKQESVNKFGDDAAVSAAIGLLFMRLLCPALHDPQEYALLVDKTHKTALEPSGVLRQQLGFMSTLLLNLAGRRIFQGKDAFLSELNDFVVANMDTIGSYIDAVSTPSSYTESGVAVPQNVLQNSYAAIVEAVENTFPKMKRYLNEQQRSDLAQACGIEA